MTTTARKTDHELKISIMQELEWTPSVEADQVGVGVTDGAVTLSGQVSSFPQKADAVAAAFRVRGVTAVADGIVVRNALNAREDADIAREAAVALNSSTAVAEGTVKAEVHDQVITLIGTVGWHYQRSAAVNLVSGLPGVLDIVNLIDLRPERMLSPAEAEAQIVAALMRNAHLDARDVSVSVQGSVITLTGNCSSWAERHEAEFAAWCTPGVTHVDDRLQVLGTSRS